MDVLKLLVFGVLILQVRPSHIQGGSSTWRVHENYGNGTVTVKATILYHIKLRSCPFEQWTPTCYSASADVTTAPVTFFERVCADTGPEEDWGTTQLVQYSVLGTTESCTMRITGNLWINSLSGFTHSVRSFSLPYFFNLSVSTNGKINSAPTALLPPVVKFFVGCGSSVLVQTMDEDGDYVSCRFAAGTLEGGSIINMNYPHLSLVGNPCRLQYAGTAIQGKYPVALIIEDRTNENQTTAKSFSSLQFIVIVAAAPTTNFTCNDKPIFVDPTPPANQVMSVTVGHTVTITLQARPSRNTHLISRFGLIGPTDVVRSNVFRANGSDFGVTLTWRPGRKHTGPNSLCFEAIEVTGNNIWIASDLRCITLTVGQGQFPCTIKNGGCSDRCVQDTIGYHCECYHSCWELLEDQRQCVPKMYRRCTNGRMAVDVEKCAVAGMIGIGDFDPNNMNLIAVECRVATNDTHHSFDFSLNDCGTERIERPDEVVYKNTIKMWIEKISSSVISRGHWFFIDFLCTVEKYQNVSGVFDPQDSSVTIVLEEGFAEIQLAFDFYPDYNFQSPFGPADYPRQYNITDRIYFGLSAESTDTDIELFTQSCTAHPEPAVDGISYPMIAGGCLQDSTMLLHPSTSVKSNFFSILTFRFNDSFAQIDNTTDVTILCEVVICVQGVANTRCTTGCVNSRSGSSQSQIISRRSIVQTKDQQVNEEEEKGEEEEEEEEEGQSKPERDPSIKQTDTIPLSKSPTFIITNSQPLRNPENGSRRTEIHKFFVASFVIVWLNLIN